MKIKILFFLVASLFISCSGDKAREKFLLFYEPQETLSLQSFLQLTIEGGIKVDTTSNFSELREDSLQYYKGVVLFRLTGDSLDFRQQTEIERYVQAGGGLVIAGTDLKTTNPWPWQNKLYSSRPEVSRNLQAEQGVEDEDSGLMQLGFDGGRVVLIPSVGNIPEESLKNALEFALDTDAVNYDKVKTKAVPTKAVP